MSLSWFVMALSSESDTVDHAIDVLEAQADGVVAEAVCVPALPTQQVRRHIAGSLARHS
jgi:hypothetical protein